MKRSKHLLSLLTLLILFAMVPQSFADISDAALLYLRIAPGSRAAGMGEAYVAVADDATATHWNPAGLGSTPLSNNWQNKNVPSYLQPLTAMTTVKARSGSGYSQFDIWTISAQGLARFDNHNWFTSETFQTKTTQTVSSIVKSYFSIENDEALAIAVEKVASANSKRSFETIKKFATDVLAAVPVEYNDREAIKSGLDSLTTLYLDCRINWERFVDAEKIFKDGMSDGTLSEKESDRINFAIEKSKTRFIPEELKIKYSDLFSGKLTTIKSIGTILLIGTDNGFYTFDGRSWKTFTTTDGLPSMHILSITSIGSKAYIGTTNGIVKYSGNTLANVDLPEGVENGKVTGIGSGNSSTIWAVIDGQLYHYNGNVWSSSHYYTAELDDTFESIATKISIFKTQSDISLIAEKIKLLNVNGDAVAQEKAANYDEGFVTENDSTDVATTDTTATEVQAEEIVQDVEPQTTHLPNEFTIEPGKPVAVPYALGIKGKINEIYVIGTNNIWIATEFGLYMFKDGVWKASGYRTINVTAGQTFTDIATENIHPYLSINEHASFIATFNGLDESAVLTEGQALLVYDNPLALEINDIASKGNGLFIGSKHGLYELNGTSLSKVDIGGMGNSSILSVKSLGGEIWYASDSRITIKANGRSDIVVMFAKWLPELTDDIYYGFLSGVTSIGGLGTVGGNITYINYGIVNRTDASGNPEGTFEPFDIGFTGSYGGSILDNLKGGFSLKYLYSHLSLVGAGAEKGAGTAHGFGVDFGLLWNVSNKFDIGMAVTNLGPDISYIDAAQSDPLPRNLAIGFKVNLLNSEYNRAIFTAEVNKSLVGLNDGFSEEIKQLVINGGAEYNYSDLFAVRLGYIYDDEGDVKAPTIGFGVKPADLFKFDFAYIPSSTNAPLANTLRISLELLP